MAKPKKKGDVDIPSHILDDLCSRFVINNERKWDTLCIFDILESAHWHYIDFYCLQMKPPPPKCSHKIFSRQVFMYLQELSQYVSDFDSLYQKWQEKKRCIPCFGGIILSPNYTHVLMVQGFGNKSAWGFPKGKQEVGEPGIACAMREINEETDLDVREQIREEASIACWIQDRFHKLYIITNVSFDTKIKPKLRREIKEHKWIPVDSLPVHKNDTAPHQADLEVNHFFNVIPFVKPLRKWIEEQRNREQQQAIPASHFTAKGRRRGKGKDSQKRQGVLGPDGDASASREGAGGASSGGNRVVKNLGEQFNDMSSSLGGHLGKHVKIMGREEVAGRNAGGQQSLQDRTVTMSTRGEHSGLPKLRLDEFHSKAMLNFQFDTQSILDIFHW